MLDLYKKVDGGMRYWKSWEKDDKTGIIYSGIVGRAGEVREIRSRLFSSFSNIIRKELGDKIRAGFAELTEDHFASLEIEYLIDGFGTEEDIDKRHRLEDKKDSLLLNTGLGYSNGGSIGSGSMEAGCCVVDFELAKKVFEVNLANTEFADYERIFRRDVE